MTPAMYERVRNYFVDAGLTTGFIVQLLAWDDTKKLTDAFIVFPVQTNISGGVVTWTGTVIANHLYNADDEFDDVIVELPPPWPSVLDIVVTGYPDGRDPESLPRVP